MRTGPNTSALLCVNSRLAAFSQYDWPKSVPTVWRRVDRTPGWAEIVSVKARVERTSVAVATGSSTSCLGDPGVCARNATVLLD